MSESSFIFEININKLLDNIKQTKNENICMLRYAVYSVYNFSNIKDYYSMDVVNINKLIIGIEEMDINQFDLLKRRNVSLLLNLLKEKYRILIGEVNNDD